MPEAYIYDHVRTPRGRGKPDGSLHEVTALRLAETALRALKDRNGLDTRQVDDVVLGCVDPVGEAGGDIARAAALGERRCTVVIDADAFVVVAVVVVVVVVGLGAATDWLLARVDSGDAGHVDEQQSRTQPARPAAESARHPGAVQQERADAVCERREVDRRGCQP